MYLSYWYFTGLLGIIALLIFVIYSANQLKKTAVGHMETAKRGLNCLSLFVLLIANLSLDSIVMDFFPLLLVRDVLKVP